MRVNFNSILYAASFGLDCVEQEVLGVTTNHAKRVAYITFKLAQARGFAGERLIDLVACAILHDNALAETVRKEAVAAVVMGEEREKIVSALKKAGYGAIIEAEGMEDAVKKAASALPGKGVVLLSPACTSWDMYPNYKKRGEHFKSIVLSLEGSS